VSHIIDRVSLIVGLFFGVILLHYFVTQLDTSLKFDELALGEGSSVNLASMNGVKVHCYDLVDAQQCLEGYTKVLGSLPVVLWLGNSQVHAINQMKSGDETAVPELYRRLVDNGHYLLTFSQPDANFQEHFLLFHYLLDQIPVKTLVMPVVFDDMRNTDIRASLVDALKDHSVSVRLAKTKMGQRLLANNSDQDAAGNDMSALEDTVQEASEKWLNAKMNKFQIWSERPTLRNHALLSLYRLRNWVLGINPSTERRMLPGSYALNRQALKAMLNEAKDRDIQVLVYVVPLRNDVPIPYNAAEYSSFKADMQALSVSQGAHFINLENLVPAKYWGTKNSTSIGGEQELDFMHFAAGGHGLLANALYRELQALQIIDNNP